MGGGEKKDRKTLGEDDRDRHSDRQADRTTNLETCTRTDRPKKTEEGQIKMRRRRRGGGEERERERERE